MPKAAPRCPRTAAQAALYQAEWSLRSAVADVSGWPVEVAQDLLRPYMKQLPREVASLNVDAARALWCVVDRNQDAVACVDTNGRLLRPDAAQVAPVDITDDLGDLALAASLATELIHQPLAQDVVRGGCEALAGRAFDIGMVHIQASSAGRARPVPRARSRRQGLLGPLLPGASEPWSKSSDGWPCRGSGRRSWSRRRGGRVRSSRR